MRGGERDSGYGRVLGGRGWHWLPDRFTELPIVVNIPEFRLRAFDSSGNPVLTMKVIVGKAFRHKTPVFEKDMRFAVFRP